MDNNLIFEIKPKYVNYIKFFSEDIGRGIFGLLVVLQIWVLVLLSILYVYNIPAPNITLLGIVFIYAIMHCIIAFFVLPLERRNCKFAYYRVYPDRVELRKGVINHTYTTLPVKNIKEIHHCQSFWQRRAGVGSIKLLLSDKFFITLIDIENSKYIYSKLNQLKEEAAA